MPYCLLVLEELCVGRRRCLAVAGVWFMTSLRGHSVNCVGGDVGSSLLVVLCCPYLSITKLYCCAAVRSVLCVVELSTLLYPIVVL